MINHYNEKNLESGGEPFDLTYYLIQVDATFTTVQTSYYGGSSQVLTSIHNQMWPTAAMLDKRKGNLKLELIFSNFYGDITFVLKLGLLLSSLTDAIFTTHQLLIR